MPLAHWACRTVTALALDAADAPGDAAAVRAAPAFTLTTAADWEQLLRELVDRVVREPEVAVYERGDDKARTTVLDVDDCALVIAIRAAASAVDLPAVDYAVRLVRQLVGPAVVDYDYWRNRSFSPRQTTTAIVRSVDTSASSPPSRACSLPSPSCSADAVLFECGDDVVHISARPTTTSGARPC
jgi:hypothetical protein